MGWILSIILFIVYLDTLEPSVIIASSIFAIAGAISQIRLLFMDEDNKCDE